MSETWSSSATDFAHAECVGIKPNYGSSATRLFKVLCMLCTGVSIKLVKEPHCIIYYV